MFTKPRNCCFIINNRIATLILSVIQTATFAAQAYISYNSETSPDSINWHLPLSLFFFAIGLFGVYGVFTKNVKFVEVFARYYWAQFLITIVTGVSLFTFALYSHTEACDIVSQDYHEFVFCKDNFTSIYSLSAIGYVFLVFIRLHFCFSIWAYYRNLQAEQQPIELPIPVASKVVYPQYAYVGDAKAPLDA